MKSFRPPVSASLTRGSLRRRLATGCNGYCNAVLRLVGPRFSRLTVAINETVAATAKAIGAVNEQISADDWIRITPFGEFPNKVGRQVVDRPAGEAMVAAFNSVSTRLATLFRGLPVYEGHPDDPEWARKNPGNRPVAVGRIKEMQLRDDGVWGRVAWNERGTSLVRGEAPAYTAQSPHWGMLPLAPRQNTFRPVEVFSLGLTNTPNIPDTLLGVNEAESESSPDMKNALIALLAALGRPVSNPSAVTDEQLATAINEATPVATQLITASNELATLRPQLATAQTALTTATNEAAALRTQIATERTARVELILTSAINEGRITTAQRTEWHGKLTANGADITAVAADLGKVKKAINTRSGVADVGARKGEANVSNTKITAINEAVAAKKAATPNLSHDAAFAAVRREKPELFTNAAE
jgi:hypothetical protein